MDFCNGGELSTKLGEYKYPEPQAAELFRNMREGVDALHSIGILHRDIKPRT